MFAMPATPAIPAMTAVVRLFNFITTLLINHRAFLLTAERAPLERLCPALVSSEVRQQRTHATTKESLTQSLKKTGTEPPRAIWDAGHGNCSQPAFGAIVAAAGRRPLDPLCPSP